MKSTFETIWLFFCGTHKVEGCVLRNFEQNILTMVCLSGIW